MKHFICVVILVLVASVASAQSEDVPRFEVGAQFSSITIKEPQQFEIPSIDSPFRTEPGIGGRFTYNITDSVAAEAEVTFFPNDNGSFNDYTAGRTTQGLFGIKAGKRFKRFGIYGKARPGFVRFGRATQSVRLVNTDPVLFDVDFGRTNFAADIGGVVEFYPSRRIVTRFDVGDTIIRFKELSYDAPCLQPVSPVPCQPQIVKVTIPGRVTHNFQLNAGIGIRFGGAPDSSPQPPSKSSTIGVPRYEVGVLFSSLTIIEPDRFSIPRFENNTFRTEAGVGGRFTYNISDAVAAEAEITFFPRDRLFTSDFDINEYTAGRATQGLFGIKAGKRFEKFGIYGKVRPGFVHFSRALRGARRFNIASGGTAAEFDFGGRTNLAVDVGGVLEFYPTRRIVTRFDIGDTIIRYDNLSFIFPPPLPANPTPLPGSFTVNVPSRTQNNFQFSAGIGVRF